MAPVNAIAPVATVGPANLWFAQHIQTPATPAKSDDEDSLLEEAKHQMVCFQQGKVPRRKQQRMAKARGK